MDLKEKVAIILCMVASIAMIIRVFFGTEITDEAYYVSDAITMMHGNVYYSYNNYSYGTGGVFLLIPFIFVYELFVPDLSGVFLYSRLCFILFWDITMYASYRIMRKEFNRFGSLMATCFMICFAGGGMAYNFSYNTVPYALSFLCGFLIYDSIEHNNKNSNMKLITAGFLMGIAVLGHLGCGLTIIVFAIVIFFRSNGVENKIKNLSCCIIGGLMEMLVVVIPVVLQSGFSTFLSGIDNKLHPYPTGTMYQGSVFEKLDKFITEFKPFFLIFSCSFVISYFSSKYYVKKKRSQISKHMYTIFSIAVAMLILSIYLFKLQMAVSGTTVNWYWGVAAGLGITTLLLVDNRNNPVIYFVGFYPILFAFASIVFIDSSASIARFLGAVPAFAILLLVLLNTDSAVTKILASAISVLCIVSVTTNNYRFVYRDDSISQLDTKIDYGVYKGIYTTNTRAVDLPELEDYLNNLIGENEVYAFRDNVPVGYMMTHNGVMCDRTTWDSLNYSYYKNAPANLYEYYKRRGMIPQKFIFVDYGRDPILSIDDPNFKMNEFINAYYSKVSDVTLNDTFTRVVVYQYSGGFNGEYDYWIERHMLKSE